MGSSNHSILFWVWTAFLVQGLAYSFLLPAWEGFDEAVHMGYITYLHNEKKLPVYGQSLLPKEIQLSIESMPVPAPLLPNSTFKYGIPGKDVTVGGHPKFEIPLYEAQHPPLYYLIMQLPYSFLASQSLMVRLFALRICSVLLASFFVLPLYGVARRVTASKINQTLILFLAIGFPVLYIDVARVGNDSLGIPLFTLLLFLAIELHSEFSVKKCVYTGVVLGCGLLTKMYFLTALIPISMVLLFALHRSRGLRGPVFRGALFLLLPAILLAAPWFIRNHHLYGIWIFTYENMTLRNVTLLQKFQQAMHLPWLHEAGVLFRSFVWVGGWSFLDLPKSIYDAFKILFTLSALGAVLQFVRYRRKFFGAVEIPLLFVFGFLIGLMDLSVASFMARHALGGAGGWYLYAVVAPIAILLILSYGGWNQTFSWGSWCGYAMIVSLVLTNVYGLLFRMLPFYSGYPGNALNRTEQARILLSSPWANLKVMVSRLAENNPHTLNSKFLFAMLACFIWGAAATVVAPLLVMRRDHVPGTK